jgi:hypothetical protein
MFGSVKDDWGEPVAQQRMVVYISWSVPHRFVTRVCRLGTCTKQAEVYLCFCFGFNFPNAIIASLFLLPNYMCQQQLRLVRT